METANKEEKIKYILKRILFAENSCYKENTMNELISLNKISFNKNNTEVEVLFSLLRVSSFSEEQNLKQEISKEEAEKLLTLVENEKDFINQVYKILKIT